VNFAVTPRSSVNIYGVQTYTFLWDQIAQGYDTAKPATFLLGSGTGEAIITGDGLFAADGVSPAAGLSASVLGAPDMIQSSVAAYTYGAGFLQFQVATAAQPTPGPQHLILSQAGETEIVPSAISLAAAPPAITAVQQNSDGTANVSGSGIGPGTRILFDGAAAAVQEAASGQLTVVPPPALPGANAAVIAVNPDGQDSNFFAPAAPPPLYAYAAGQPPSIQLTPAFAPAGAELLLDITGTNVNFAAANLQAGLGSSDILVQNMWMIAPQHAVAQVAISKSAQQGPTTVTLSSGLQLLEIPAGFQVTAPEPEAPMVVSAFENTFEPGGVFILCVGGVPPFANSRDFRVTIGGPNGDEGAVVFFSISGPVLFLYAPADLPPGPVLVKVDYRGADLAPILFIVGAPNWPNIVQTAAASSGLVYSDANPAFPGDSVAVTVQNLADSLAPMDVSSITVTVGGAVQTVTLVQQNNNTGTATVRFQLNPQTAVRAAGSLPLTVAYDGRVSLTVPLPIAPQ
jgi:hypothetical protein